MQPNDSSWLRDYDVRDESRHNRAIRNELERARDPVAAARERIAEARQTVDNLRAELHHMDTRRAERRRDFIANQAKALRDFDDRYDREVAHLQAQRAAAQDIVTSVEEWLLAQRLRNENRRGGRAP